MVKVEVVVKFQKVNLIDDGKKRGGCMKMKFTDPKHIYPPNNFSY